EDIAQEVFIRVYKGLPYFKHQSKFTTWLYRIVHNVAISEIRKNRPQLASAETLEKLPTTVRQDNPSEALTEKQVKEKLGKALDDLPENYRMVLLLYYMEGVSYTEISRILDLPIGTVKTYLHRGKKMLRQSLFNLSNPQQYIP
ncbi:MAG: hypothetical protein A2Y62_19090, partial [Candidatus Fischerbacteria bacterium RBG_13_37_8]